MACYVCWGEDGEDLSDKVEDAIQRAQERGDWEFAMDEDDRAPLEIEVRCSMGHRNLFEV